jgi:hypothetical protein
MKAAVAVLGLPCPALPRPRFTMWADRGRDGRDRGRWETSPPCPLLAVDQRINHGASMRQHPRVSFLFSDRIANVIEDSVTIRSVSATA